MTNCIMQCCTIVQQAAYITVCMQQPLASPAAIHGQQLQWWNHSTSVKLTLKAM